MGPTASGKSALAEAIAAKHGLQLISADAFMVYRGLDIGTNKPADKAMYELLDIVGPEEEFGVGEWVQRASELLWQIYHSPSPLRGGGARGEGSDNESPSHHSPSQLRTNPNKPEPTRANPNSPTGAIIVGGTGFYVRALLEEYSDLMPAPDPAVRERLEDRERAEGLAALAQELSERAPDIAQATDLKNPVRVRRALERLADPRPPIAISLPPFRKLKFVLDPPQADLDKAIAARTAAMLNAGWPEEVRSLLENGLPRTAPALRAIGYDSVIELLEGRLGEEDARARITTATRQYAKRQKTWLRAEPDARTATPEEIMDCIDSLGQ